VLRATPRPPKIDLRGSRWPPTRVDEDFELTHDEGARDRRFQTPRRCTPGFRPSRPSLRARSTDSATRKPRWSTGSGIRTTNPMARCNPIADLGNLNFDVWVNRRTHGWGPPCVGR
jgi:hypothetical protein